MKYTVTKSVVWIIGKIWLPPITAAYHYELSESDVENIMQECDDPNDPDIRDLHNALDNWLSKNAGDFQAIIDFSASLEWNGQTIDLEWVHEGSELIYNDCVGEG